MAVGDQSAIYIDVLAPQDGIVPAKEGNLFEVELQRVVRLIRSLAAPGRAARATPRAAAVAGRPAWATGGAGAAAAPRPFEATRRGILIEGARGVGKTSFLRAVMATVNDTERIEKASRDEPDPQVYPLPLLDPTLISGDRTFIAAVIANVLRAVDRETGDAEGCDPKQRLAREALMRSVQRLHGGLLAEDEETWRGLTDRRSVDHQFVDHLLQMARGGIDLAECFEAFCRAAADLLGADMLIQPLDDVDLAGPEAYATLEAVRRYLTGPSLLPIVAGDLDQFVAMLWERRLQQEAKGLDALKRADTDKEGRYKDREMALRDAAVQHLNKVLRPDHRLNLTPRRDELLRRGVYRAASGREELPIFAAGRPGLAAVPRDHCLLGQAEAALLPSTEGVASGALLGVLPNNTRDLMLALATVVHLTKAELSPRDALRALVQVNIHALREVEVNLSVLEALGEDGPTAETAHLLTNERRWSTLASGHSVALDPVAAPAAARAFVHLFGSRWIAKRPSNALSILGRHAHLLLDDGSVTVAGGLHRAYAHELARGVSASALRLAELLRRAGGTWARLSGPCGYFLLERVGEAELAWLHARASAIRTQWYQPPVAPVGQRPGYSPTIEERLAPMLDELWPYTSIRTGIAVDLDRHQPFAEHQRLEPPESHREAESQLVLSIATTAMPSEGTFACLLDPFRTLEVAAVLVESLLAVEAATGPLNDPELARQVATGLEHLASYNHPAAQVLVATNANNLPRWRRQLRARELELSGTTPIVSRLCEWFERFRAMQAAGGPDLATLASAHMAWLENVEQIHALYGDKRLGSVGGYLERTTLSLFAAVLGAEHLRLRPSILDGSNAAQIAERQKSWRELAWRHEQRENYIMREDAQWPFKQEMRELWGPVADLLAYTELCADPRATRVSGQAQAASSVADWAAKHLPLSTLILTCPLLRLHLSKAWNSRLSQIWPVGELTIDAGIDSYTLLCSFPIAVGVEQPGGRSVKQIQKQLWAMYGRAFGTSDTADSADASDVADTSAAIGASGPDGPGAASEAGVPPAPKVDPARGAQRDGDPSKPATKSEGEN